MSEEMTIGWGEQLMSGLAFMHTLDVVHRDIREDNLFLTNHPQELNIGDLGKTKSVAAERLEEAKLWKMDDVLKAGAVLTRMYQAI